MAGLISKSIKYRDGYAGQLAESAFFQLPKELWPNRLIETEFIRIDATGMMQIRQSYAWDYASLPIFKRLGNWIQGKKSKVPSLAHDALCQIHRMGLMDDLPDARLHIDRFFKFLLDERHFWKWRGRLWFKGVRIGARGKSSNKPILEAT